MFSWVEKVGSKVRKTDGDRTGTHRTSPVITGENRSGETGKEESSYRIRSGSIGSSCRRNALAANLEAARWENAPVDVLR